MAGGGVGFSLYEVVVDSWVCCMSAGFSGVASKALGIAAVVIGAVVAIVLIATLYPTYGGAVANLTENVTSTDLGDSTANSLRPIFALIISLAGLFAIVGLVFLGMSLKK